jgi:hypothetical protein
MCVSCGEACRASLVFVLSFPDGVAVRLLRERSLLIPVSGSPANRTQRDAVISRVWATSPRLPLLVKSGASESNREPPAPKAGVLPTAPPPDRSSTSSSTPWGSRTRQLRLERPPSSPLDQRGMHSSLSLLVSRCVRRAPGAHEWAHEALESSSAVLQTAAQLLLGKRGVSATSPRSTGMAATRSSQQKRPGVATPGLGGSTRECGQAS